MSPQRRQVPYSADERTTLLAFLDRQRSALRDKTAGLDADQLAATLAPSDLTLGGMLKHLAYVEDWWFGVNLAGLPPQPPFDDDAAWKADNDWDWHSAVDDSPDDLRRLLDTFIGRSDDLVEAAQSLDMVAVRRVPSSGEGVSLRWILVHMIEEYARHLGHADLIRQSIDGQTGV